MASESQPHCCFFLQGRCTFPKCVYSHDKDRVVTSCIYGAMCKHRHFGLNRLASEVIPETVTTPLPTDLPALLDSLRGEWVNSFNDRVSVDWPAPGDWRGRPRTALQVVVRRAADERRFFLRQLPDQRIVCGQYELHMDGTTQDKVAWVDNGPTGFDHYWTRVQEFRPQTEAKSNPWEVRQNIINAVLAGGGEMLISQLGGVVCWKDLRAEHGQLQAFLEKWPWLFVVSNPNTGHAKVRVDLSCSAAATVSPPPGLDLADTPPGLDSPPGLGLAWSQPVLEFSKGTSTPTSEVSTCLDELLGKALLDCVDCVDCDEVVEVTPRHAAVPEQSAAAEQQVPQNVRYTSRHNKMVLKME